MTNFADLQEWSAAALGASGDGLNNAIKSLTEAMDDLESHRPSSDWTGAASDAALQTHADLTASLADDIDQLQQVKVALFDAESATARLEQDLQTLLAQARFEGFGISEVGEVYDICLAPEFPTSEEDAEARKAERKAKQSQLADQVAKLLADAANIDAPLTAALTKIAGTQADVEYDNGDTYGELPQEVIDAWAAMTDEERRHVLQKLADQYAAQYGIPPVTVQYEVMKDKEDNPELDFRNYGYWNDVTRRLAIDDTDLPNALASINTVAHEMRHAGQHEMVRDANPNFFQGISIKLGWEQDPFQHPGITKEQAEEWRKNFDNYKASDPNKPDSWDPYLNQPVERDARTVAEQEVNGMTIDKLNELRK